MALDHYGASDSDYALQYLSSDEALAMLKFTMQCDFNVQVCLMPLYKELIDAVYADITSHSVSLQTSSSQSLCWTDILQYICTRVNKFIIPAWINECVALKAANGDPKQFFPSAMQLNRFLSLRSSCITSLLAHFARASSNEIHTTTLLPPRVLECLGKPEHHSLITVADALVDDPLEVYHYWSGLLTWLAESPDHCASTPGELQKMIDGLKVDMGLAEPDEHIDPEPVESRAVPAPEQREQPEVEHEQPAASPEVSTADGSVPGRDAAEAEASSVAVVPANSEANEVNEGQVVTQEPLPQFGTLALTTVGSDWLRKLRLGTTSKCRSWQFIKHFMLKAETTVIEHLQKDTLAHCKYVVGPNTTLQLWRARASAVPKISMTFAGRLTLDPTPMSYCLATIGAVSVYVDGN